MPKSFCSVDWSLEELADDAEPIDEAVVSLKDEMLLELPRFWLHLTVEVIRKLLLELAESGPEVVEDLQRDDDLVQRFLNFDLN